MTSLPPIIEGHFAPMMSTGGERELWAPFVAVNLLPPKWQRGSPTTGHSRDLVAMIDTGAELSAVDT
jgi:hypothetical protein